MTMECPVEGEPINILR